MAARENRKIRRTTRRRVQDEKEQREKEARERAGEKSKGENGKRGVTNPVSVRKRLLIAEHHPAFWARKFS
jgi:hypothetical protein